MREQRPRVVVVGAGFGGLNAAQRLAKLPVRVTVIDRKNHHTFQPLLYQVALAVLSPAEIAQPVRGIFARRRNVTALLGNVTDFDLAGRKVTVEGVSDGIPYDYLVVAAGATHAYFNHPEWARFAPGLKTIEDALEIRGRVLKAFERAELMAAARGRHEPLNFVVVGGGATGVELAGAIADIAKRYMVHDFRAIDPAQARVILLEGGPRVLATYPDELSESAARQLGELGVEVRTDALVTDMGEGYVCVGDERIASAVTLWAAGVSASPLGRKLTDKIDRAGRVKVEGDLSVPGHPEVFVIGDLALYPDEEGKPVPGVSPAAIQMGQFAARQIGNDLRREPRETFHYWDKGSLATIGRNRAVADIGAFHFGGFIAWLAWLFIHVFFLIGFRNRVFVILEWAWAYFTYKRSARLITERN